MDLIMNKIKNFLKAVSDIIVETRKLKAEAYARKYSNI
jgi:hypothetical protein